MIDQAILDFYGSYDEDRRLRERPHGRIELLRTQEILLRHLPTPPARVLDIGGGTGVHAEWLVAAGFQVELLDPVPAHVHAAVAAGLDASHGHAGDLPWDDDTADATLLLGPLYHLVDPADRAAALAEAVRVTRPGGLVAAAGISRYAGLLELVALGAVTGSEVDSLRAAIRTGVNPPGSGFTTAYFHQPEELRGELSAAGLRDVRVVGVEGPGAPHLLTVNTDELDRHLDSALNAARMLEDDPRMIPSSPHLLALGRVADRA
ncbi:methyltransferase domain-containing protein [Actinotalea sp. M2MS4P-6]|uniref:class I SAM-dependent methyltransferase n=1 Tax=Actinotalea sp. M2MS4P-6 TaxID=2983762 RepID=UPI0021E3DBCE|nr:methyltransferase domain-containing protein [Actinotalea sp. M2MS4P-6]MCV2393842.1 methyltransferase domain-containing protein [Actinotalea sp. M2MS4P-6]